MNLSRAWPNLSGALWGTLCDLLSILTVLALTCLIINRGLFLCLFALESTPCWAGFEMEHWKGFFAQCFVLRKTTGRTSKKPHTNR